MLMNVPAVLLALAMPLAWIDAASLGDAAVLTGWRRTKLGAIYIVERQR